MQAIVRTIGVGVSLLMTAWLIAPLLIAGSVRPDFSVFWAAAHFALASPHKAYDASAMGIAQAWARSPAKGPRIFPYPPTALLLLAPWGVLRFWTAYWSWVTLSIGAFWTAARRVTSRRAACLAVIMPHPILVLILGQTTLFASSAAIWAISLLHKRPVIAGALFSISAALKPQSVFLVPLVFLRIRDWRPALSMACMLTALVVASFTLGLGLWRSWLDTLFAFPSVVSGYHLEILGATPRMAALALGWGQIEVGVLQLAGIVTGASIVWRGFGSHDVLIRVVSLGVGCLLAAPYAMRYDVAVLAPVVATALITASPRSILIALPAFAMNAVAIVPAILVSAITALRGRPSTHAGGGDRRADSRDDAMCA